MNGLVKGLLAIVVLGGILCLADALWIPAKAAVAQILLQNAWGDARSAASPVKPWPWADTWPVGRIVQKRMQIDEIILAGDSGEALAFGPGHLTSSALPGEDGHCVLAGHRDTSFAFLEDLQRGDELLLEGRGSKKIYRVQKIQVSEAQDLYLDVMQAGVLTLITCYPFGGILPTTKRLVITAEHVL